MTIQRTDVFGIMRPDMELVDTRVVAEARVDYPVASSLIENIVSAGGKRLRPLILLLAGRSYTYDIDLLVTAGAGVELLHTASLVHDDTVDRAEIRRGKPTLNSILSTGAVILIGDFLFAQSAMLAAATGSPRVVSVFASTLGDLCNGQLREMFNAHRLDQTQEEYELRIYGKTASLFAGSAEMGAILAQAPEDHIRALRQYGSDLGIAFQIVDDILDFTGGESLGKPSGNDLRQGTVTLPTLLYAASLGQATHEYAELKSVVTGSNEDESMIELVIGRIRDSGALDKSAEVAEEFVERAKVAACIVPDEETRDLLHEVAELAIHRVS